MRQEKLALAVCFSRPQATHVSMEDKVHVLPRSSSVFLVEFFQSGVVPARDDRPPVLKVKVLSRVNQFFE